MSHSLLKKSTKRLNSSALFPEIQKELQVLPPVSTVGLFIIQVLKNKEKQEEWCENSVSMYQSVMTAHKLTVRYLLFKGRDAKPTVSKDKPAGFKKGIPIVLLEIEDADILKFVTGGLTGTQALSQKKIKILGDLELAMELQTVFTKAGGVEKAMAFLKKSKL